MLAIVVGALLWSSAAGAQVHGQFTGAQTVATGGRMFGAYLVSSENVLGVLAQLRLSFYPNVDFGFNGGIARQDFGDGHRTTLRLGTGLKVKIADSTASMPFALALAGDLGVETGDEFHVLTISPALVASRTFPMGTSAVTPYGRFGITISNVDAGELNDSDVSFPLHLGAEFQLAQQIRLAVELQFHLSDAFNDNLGIGAGVNLPF